MNQKGFTLVELIAMMVVLSVLMAITIPNISGIIKNNRESIGVEDVNKMIGNAKQKMETKRASFPGKNECVVMSLKFIDNNNDFKKGVNDGEYDKLESFVIITKKQMSGSTTTSQYKYYVRLVEEKSSKHYIVDLVDYDEFSKNPDKHTATIKEFTETEKLNLLTSTKEEIKQKINEVLYDPTKATVLCDSIREVYSG